MKFLLSTFIFILSFNGLAQININLSPINPLIDPFFGPINESMTSSLQDSAEYNFEGIVGLSNCSGSLIRFEENFDPNKKAIMLTNGHCMGLGSYVVMGTVRMPDMGEVISNYPQQRVVDLFHQGPSPVGSVNTTKVIYGTMTYTDIALYELDKTYQQIYDAYSIRPLVLKGQAPYAGINIQIISGFWKIGYQCNIDKTIFALQEDVWTFKNSLLYSQPGCETKGGTSGSPIIDTDSREVIGINNTGNENGEECTLMNPCEIDEHGNITAQQGRSYGQQTYWIYSCLDGQGNFNLQVSGCVLPKGK